MAEEQKQSRADKERKRYGGKKERKNEASTLLREKSTHHTGRAVLGKEKLSQSNVIVKALSFFHILFCFQGQAQ